MSEILVNKLTGTSTAGSILVTGEGNSTTTNLQQGLCKAWINFDGQSTGAVGDYDRDSLNCAMTVDNGTGNYTIGFTSSMGNANYVVGGCTGGNSTDPLTYTGAFLCPQQTSSTFNIRTGSNNADSDNDRPRTYSTIHGDLA